MSTLIPKFDLKNGGVTPTGAVNRPINEKLSETISVKDFGAVGDGVTDDTVAIQNAVNVGIAYMPAGVYAVSNEIIIPTGNGLVGATAFWKTRTTYNYVGSGASVLKYIGAGGANTCVVRVSEDAVGVEGGSTTDLINVTVKNFHIDCDELAEIGCYIYRAGYNSEIGNITSEKAVKYNHVHLGCYEAEFGTFGAYESVDAGVSVGWDIFGWDSVEATCFAYTASFRTSNNGTGGTYPADDLACSGGLFSVGRGSRVFITSESNEGRACIISSINATTYTIGPVDYCLEYLEGNADGPYVKYYEGTNNIRLFNGFIHPGNASGTLDPQNITIRSVNGSGTPITNGGPSDESQWLTLERLYGYATSGGIDYNFTVDSNTFKYKIRDCEATLIVSNKQPSVGNFVSYANLVAAAAYFKADNPVDVRNTVNGTLTRTGTGVYTLTFDNPFQTSQLWNPNLSIVASTSLDNKVRVTSSGRAAFIITTYNSSGVAEDTGDLINLSISGIVDY